MGKLYLLTLFAFASLSYAQTVTVKDINTDEPLELVTIFSETPRAFTATNPKGQADISRFKESKNIKFSRVGYKTETFNFDQIAANEFIVELSPTNINLDEVVVAATRWNQVSGDIPSKITAVTPKQIELHNPQTAADLLTLSGQVFIQKSQQGGGSPMIRGFATNRLLYAIDGVRMNTAIFRGGNIQNVISLDPFAIEHAEVLFGPSSVVYGSDAIGGVMTFRTLTPQFALNDETLIAGKAISRYSSANNEFTGHFDVNVGKEKWAIITSVSSNDYDDLKMGSSGPSEYLRPNYVKRIDNSDVVVASENEHVQTPSGYSQINFMQKIRISPNSNWDINYGFHLSETSSYSRYDRHLRERNGTARYGEWKYGPQKWSMNLLDIEHEDKNMLYDQASLRLAYQFFEESRISRNFNDPLREVRKEEVYAYSGNLDFIKKLSDLSKLFYGFEAVANDVNSIGRNEDIVENSVARGPSRYPQANWSSYAIYLSNQLRFTESFLIQAGLRYNQFILTADFDTTFYPFPFTNAEINNASLTGSLGFVFRPNEEWVISANAASAFRSPNVDDIGKVFDSEPGSVVVPNPELDAEYAYNVDLGVAKIFDDFLKADVTGYYTILDNALVRRDFTLNGRDSIVYEGELSKVQAIQNASTATVYGIQAGIEIKLPAGFKFSSILNYQKGEEELDDGSVSPSRHAAPWFGITRFSYDANKLNLQLNVSYSGKKSFNELPEEEKGKTEIYAINSEGNPYSPGWYTINFKAAYHLIEHLSISAGLENITDQRYKTYSSGIAAAGRNFILSLRANF